ncbi:nitroreductase family protein [Tepidibacter mesophilus]|uniref:nitroreductase family protein n=1 Tax=Tepidibacter mesophilus TaxID=655607 RepID=UPI000C08449C|nr:nitroreductase family protein [Tepidibacter mesophilus]
MIKVDSGKCIGCMQCVKDCFPNDIQMINGKAKVNNITCIKCGHCIAVCPKGAVSTDEYNMKDVKDYNKEEFTVDADNLLNLIKFRRSVRQFTNKEVEEEKITKIIESGRFTQTGINLQDVSYIVVREGLDELKSLTFQTLSNVGKNLLDNLTPETMPFKKYGQMWIKMYEEYKKNPIENDKLFFNAPAVIIVTANSPLNGALASSNMELMTNALGLGTFFSGFFVKAAEENKKIMDLLGVKDGKKIVTCMVIGYPNVKYLRTVPRKKADICWT